MRALSSAGFSNLPVVLASGEAQIWLTSLYIAACHAAAGADTVPGATAMMLMLQAISRPGVQAAHSPSVASVPALIACCRLHLTEGVRHLHLQV